VRLLDRGENDAVQLLARLGPLADTVPELAHRLFQIAERKGRNQDARRVDMLVRVFPDLRTRSRAPGGGTAQLDLLEERTS